ncbi:MAG: dihydroorotate dehydrogenase, partial [Actinomycetia bacterium]|nr:dihydroorotate dehydrogenase [Actinomycetes bacterium]
MTTSPHGSTDLRVRIGALELANPLMNASGTFATGFEYADFIELAQMGALVTKGVSPVSWPGNAGRRLHETASGMLNSIGLQNPGVESFKENELKVIAHTAPGVPVIVNVCGHRASEYAEVIDMLEDEAAVSAYELNISCPNVDCGGMAVGVDAQAAAEVTSLCRAKTTRPLIVKLTPNVTDITLIARAVEAAGADAVSLINTVLGLAIDAQRRKLIFERGVAGLSGPAIKPVALRAVWECAQAVDIPLIGMGGAVTGTDVAEFLLAGATAVALGTANFI